ncbi:MAG: hypothetical protein RL230_2563, partial [Pseudomonadota bacterium]
MKPVSLPSLATIALAIAALPSVAPGQAVPPQLSAPVSVAQNPLAGTQPLLSFNTVVETRIRPQTGRLLEQLAAGGRTTNLDGIPVFNGSDKFLTGKIAIGYAE